MFHVSDIAHAADDDPLSDCPDYSQMRVVGPHSPVMAHRQILQSKSRPGMLGTRLSLSGVRRCKYCLSRASYSGISEPGKPPLLPS